MLTTSIVSFIVGLIVSLSIAFSKQGEKHPEARDGFVTILFGSLINALLYGLFSWLGLVWVIRVLVMSKN